MRLLVRFSDAEDAHAFAQEIAERTLSGVSVEPQPGGALVAFEGERLAPIVEETIARFGGVREAA